MSMLKSNIWPVQGPFLKKWWQVSDAVPLPFVSSRSMTNIDTEDRKNFIVDCDGVVYLKKNDGLKAYIVSYLLRRFVDQDASPKERLILEESKVKNASKIIIGLKEIARSVDLMRSDVKRLAKIMAVLEVCGEGDPNILNFCINQANKVVKVDHGESFVNTIANPFANKLMTKRAIKAMYDNNVVFRDYFNEVVLGIKRLYDSGGVAHLFSKEHLGGELYSVLHKDKLTPVEVDQAVNVANKPLGKWSEVFDLGMLDHPSVLLGILRDRIDKKYKKYCRRVIDKERARRVEELYKKGSRCFITTV